MKKLITFLTQRTLVTNLLVVFILVSAVASMNVIKRLGFPRVDLGNVFITTVYPGASPSDVELNVTVKIEEVIREVDGIEKITSSSYENRSRITVKIDPDADDPEGVKDDIRRAVDRINDFPEEVEDRPHIFEEKIDNFPIYEVAIYAKTHEQSQTPADIGALRKHAKRLKKALLTIPSVARVGEQGVPDPEVKILLNKNKLKSKQVSFTEVIQAIQQNKLRANGGALESYTNKRGIVTLSEFREPGAISNLIIRSNIEGESIKLGDVATVEEGYEKQDIVIRNNGQPGMTLFVVKKGNADIIDAVDEIKAKIAEYKEKFLSDDVDIVTMFDQAADTRKRLNTVYQNAFAGFFLLLIVLMIFLDPKVAFWTTFGIPLAMAIAIITLPFFGITINSISLVGMVVVLGMLVDDAIIVADSIYKGKEAGMSGLEAALFGLDRVYYPVMATIATTIISFTPMFFLPGEPGKFAVEIPAIVIIMLLSSFIEATTILPAHLAHTSPHSQYTPPGQGLIKFLESAYRSVLTVALRHRFLSSLGCIAFLVFGGYFSMKVTSFKMFPIDDAFIFNIYGESLPGSSLQHTYRVTHKLEDLIKSHPKAKELISSMKTQVGIKSPYANQGGNTIANGFTTRIVMVPSTERDITADDYRTYLRQKVLETKLDQELKLDYYIDGGGPPQGKPLEINVTGNDDDTRHILVKEVMAKLKDLPLLDVDADLTEGKEELTLLPKYEDIAKTGLHVANIASTIRTAFDGSVVTHLNTPEDQIPFRVQLDDESINFDTPLDGLTVSNNRGNHILIENLVTTSKGRSPKAIHHLDGYRTTKITANIDTAKATPTEIRGAIDPILAEVQQRNPDFEIKVGGEAEKDSETLFNLMVALGGAVIAIYFLMVIQFNSFTQPGMVLMGLPFGLIGITIAFGLHGENLSMLALVGVMGFSGVVVNDSLIMVEFINRLRKERKAEGTNRPHDDDYAAEFSKDVVEGAITRLRPILLTTFSTVAGLLPTAYGWVGGYDSFLSPMVLAMTWGLVVGTTSILIVIPILYDLNDQFFRILKRLRYPLLGNRRN